MRYALASLTFLALLVPAPAGAEPEARRLQVGADVGGVIVGEYANERLAVHAHGQVAPGGILWWYGQVAAGEASNDNTGHDWSQLLGGVEARSRGRYLRGVAGVGVGLEWIAGSFYDLDGLGLSAGAHVGLEVVLGPAVLWLGIATSELAREAPAPLLTAGLAVQW